MRFFILTLSLLALTIGYPVLIRSGEHIYFLFSLFICINTVILFVVNKANNYKQVILVNFVFTGWMIYGGLNLYRCSWINNIDISGFLTLVYWSYIFGLLLLFFGYRLSSGIKIKNGFKFSKIVISERSFFIVGIIYIAFQLWVIHIAGGFKAYFYAAYAEKVDESVATFVQLFGQITGFAGILAIPFLLRKNSTVLCRIFALIILLFYLIMGVARGTSMGLLSTILAIFCYITYSTFKFYDFKRYRKRIIILIVCAMLGGLFIRMNRNDMEGAKISNITESIDELFLSPSFDAGSNLEFIYKKMDVQYQPSNFSYPIVNFLPRKIFPWKPMDFGRVVVQKRYGVDRDVLYGVISSPMGEFYYDFGVIGIAFGMIFIGFIVGFIQTKINLSPPAILSAFILMVVSYSATQLAGWYIAFATVIVRMAIFLVLLLFINKIVLKYGK